MGRTATLRKKPQAEAVAAIPARTGAVYAVTRSRGPAWDPALSLEAQTGFEEHALFLAELEASGFLLLGGPLDGTPYVMLAVRADSEIEARRMLSPDPWELSRHIETTRISGWKLGQGAGRL
jgi:uncharacterized protein YciI